MRWPCGEYKVRWRGLVGIGAGLKSGGNLRVGGFWKSFVSVGGNVFFGLNSIVLMVLRQKRGGWQGTALSGFQGDSGVGLIVWVRVCIR